MGGWACDAGTSCRCPPSHSICPPAAALVPRPARRLPPRAPAPAPRPSGAASWRPRPWPPACLAPERGQVGGCDGLVGAWQECRQPWHALAGTLERRQPRSVCGARRWKQQAGRHGRHGSWQAQQRAQAGGTHVWWVAQRERLTWRSCEALAASSASTPACWRASSSCLHGGAHAGRQQGCREVGCQPGRSFGWRQQGLEGCPACMCCASSCPPAAPHPPPAAP